MPSNISPDPAPVVDVGTLWIRTVSVLQGTLIPNLEFRSYLGVNPPKPSEGYGGWAVVARRRRRGLVEWEGAPPLKMDVEFMLSRFKDGVSVEPRIESLEQMAGIGGGEPPVVYWYANAMHDNHEDPDRMWVIEDIQWDVIDSNDYGNVVRAGGVIFLRHFIPDEYIATGAKKNRDKDGKSGKHIKTPKVIKTNQSLDTLKEIAKKYLGSSRRWHELRDLNPKIKDPNKHIKSGTRIRIYK